MTFVTIASPGRSTRRMPAFTRSCHYWSPSRRRRLTSWRRSRSVHGSGADHGPRWRDVAGRPVDRSGGDPRLLEALRPRARDQPDERWVRVEPGCVLDELNRALKPHGLLFAPDISTSNRATIGGMIANNSSGADRSSMARRSIMCWHLKVVLADGSVVDLGPLSEAEVEASAPARPRRCLLPRHPATGRRPRR